MAKLSVAAVLVIAVVASVAHAAFVTFWDQPRFQGEYLTTEFEGKNCNNVNSAWDNKAVSLATHDSCIIFYDEENCGGQGTGMYAETASKHNLSEIKYDQKISSFRLCPRTP